MQMAKTKFTELEETRKQIVFCQFYRKFHAQGLPPEECERRAKIMADATAFLTSLNRYEKDKTL